MFKKKPNTQDDNRHQERHDYRRGVAFLLNTNLVRKVQIVYPDGTYIPAQVSEVLPFPIGGDAGGPVIPLNTNLVRKVQIIFPDANGQPVQVSAENPLPIA